MIKLSTLDDSYFAKFVELLTSRWEEVYNNTDIFRYNIDKCEDRILNEKYIVHLNPYRNIRRRAPQEMNSVSQPFDNNKFNFTKVSPKEILFSIEDEASDIHTVLVNNSPISRYHSLLCPSVNKCLPQVSTAESLALAMHIMFVAQDECRNLRILFNSLCGFASVNHLHYHLFIDKNNFYVETVEWQHLKGSIHRLKYDNYPVPAFCFNVQKHSISQTSQDIYKIAEHFVKKSIAHNILMTRRTLGIDDSVRVFIWPRKSTMGAKQISKLNAGVLELSGWFPVYDMENFNNLTADDLEKEIVKWNIEDFDSLCKEIMCL